MKKLKFIYHPKAGKAKIRIRLADILDLFARSGYEITAAPTQARGDAEIMAKELPDGYDLLVVSGGDGTLDEVVAGLMIAGKRVPIGYIPAGSTNDFGRSLKLPKRMDKAAEIALYGRDFCCDVGKFNEGYFVYVAAFGIFTDVTYATPQETKNRLGYGAYLIESAKRLSEIKTFHLRVTSEKEVFEGDFLAGIVSNSKIVGGIRALSGPDVSLDDGVFEVLLIKVPPTILEWNETLLALADRRVQSEYVISFHTTKVLFDSTVKIAWTLDGEFGGESRYAEISVVPKAIDIRIP